MPDRLASTVAELERLLAPSKYADDSYVLDDPKDISTVGALKVAARALLAEREILLGKGALLRAENKRLRAEREPGPMPHRCTNDECGTIQYGPGYKACPGCGGVQGRADLGEGDSADV